MNSTGSASYYEDVTGSFYGSTEINNGNTSTSAEIYYMTALRTFVGILGILGNLAVCLVVTHMKSTEVKILIVSQAFIDFLTSLVFVAGTLTNRFIFTQLVSPKNQTHGYAFCLVWHYNGLLFCLFTISTYNLVAISFERCIAVIHALWYRTNFTSRKAMILGAALWIIAPTMQIIMGALQTTYIEGNCQWNGLMQPILGVVGVCVFLWDFFIPCLIMWCCFTRISIELRKQDKRAVSLKGVAVSADERSATSRSRNVTKTFLVVFSAFVFCWITNQLLFLQRNLEGYYYHGTPENYFADTMALLNIAINPYIYAFRFKQYRDKLKQMVCCCRVN